jgi:hypothetical protein
MIDLKRMLFFCDQVCSQEPVIRTTREIRRRPHITCTIAGNQKCHILGLNAAKVIFNHYGIEECLRVDEETIKALIIAINDPSNIYCCSVEENQRDKEIEDDFLSVFIYKTKKYDTLCKEAQEMYAMLKVVFGKILQEIGKEHRSVIETILADFEALVPVTVTSV